MSVLLDTNVLSELLRARPDAAVLAWFASQPANGLFVSAVTQAEMMLGARLLPAGKRRQRLEQALGGAVPRRFCRPRVAVRLRRRGRLRRSRGCAARRRHAHLPVRRADRSDCPEPSFGPGHTQRSRLRGLRPGFDKSLGRRLARRRTSLAADRGDPPHRICERQPVEIGYSWPRTSAQVADDRQQQPGRQLPRRFRWTG